MLMWNLWHGCHRKSEGCLHCYVFRRDEAHGLDANLVRKTAAFDLPVRRTRRGTYRLAPGSVLWTCFTSDFFLEEADAWRPEAWRMMRERSDVDFRLVTKRPERIRAALPDDWGQGYAHVTIGCTMENQQRADERLPILFSLPLARTFILCEPLLGPITFRNRLRPPCTRVIIGGESGPAARLCDFAWVRSLRDECLRARVSLTFKQTGALFRKDGRIYHLERRLQGEQARRAGLNLEFPHASSLSLSPPLRLRQKNLLCLSE